jgi:anti-sigma factor RsiW
MLHPEDGILHAYLDGECTDSEEREIEEHLAGCTECKSRLEEARGIGLEAGSLLSELELGPIHAPPWRELERRAEARRAAALGEEEPELAEPSDAASPFWRMPRLAWAASLVVAFGLGYLVSVEWPGILTEPDRVAITDLQAQQEMPSVSEEENAAAEALERREGEVRASLPETTPAEDRPGADRDTEAFEAADEIGQIAAGEGDLADRRVGLEEGAPPGVATPPAQAPAGPPADPAVPVGAVRKDESAAGRREAEAAEEKAARQAFAARKKPAEAEEEVGRVVPATAATPQTRARGVIAAPEPTVVVEENVAGGVAGYGVDLDNFAAPVNEDESRPVSAIGFLSVSPESAETWLGAPLRTLPDLTLVRVEVGPGSVVDGALAGRPLVALFYEDAAGQRVTLLQQHAPSPADDVAEPLDHASTPAMIVTPAGVRAYRWQISGYQLTLIGELSSESLRALADRVR